MHSVIISAPFGNYSKLLRFANVTHTLGTYTRWRRSWSDRPFGSRWFRVLTTLRYAPSLGGWKNKIGLKNPGIDSYVASVKCEKIDPIDKIVSVYGWNMNEWQSLFVLAASTNPLAIEVNAGCPNVDKPPFEIDVFKAALDTGCRIIVKIPPIFYQKIVDMAVQAGITQFHACNTLPFPYGGISGKPLLNISLGVVAALRTQLPEATIIGGGGITCLDDAVNYTKNGANHVALGTMLFNPFNWLKINNISTTVGKMTELTDILNGE